MEILAAFAFLSISYKSISLLYPNRHSVLYLAIISLIIYSSYSFGYGDSAEEFCLPLIAYALFVGLKTIVSNRPITPTQAFFVGLTAAAVLWIKYTMVGFYIGWIVCLIYIYIKNKWQYQIASTFLYAFIGLIALSIPIFIYFCYHNSINVMLNVYFFNNATHYSGGSIPLNFTQSLLQFMVKNILLFILIVCGFTFYNTKRVIIYLLLSLATTIIFIFSFRIAIYYYSFILAAFAPFGIGLFNGAFKYINSHLLYLIISSFVLYCIYIVYNNPMSFLSEEETIQYKFNKIIQQESNPTLLNYGFLDGGFYTYSGIVPSNRYFCNLNISIPEIMEGQDSIVDNCSVKFIVIDPNKKSLTSSNYHQVAVAQGMILHNDMLNPTTYILYKLNDSICVSANKIQN